MWILLGNPEAKSMPTSRRLELPLSHPKPRSPSVPAEDGDISPTQALKGLSMLKKLPQ